MLIKLVSPKRNPRAAPFLGPISSEAIMTGTWMIVALVNPSGMYPRKGVNAMMHMTAPKIATWTMLIVLILLPACGRTFSPVCCLPVFKLFITASFVIILSSRYNTVGTALHCCKHCILILFSF